MCRIAAALLLLIVAGCRKPSPPAPPAKAVLGEWIIVSINGKTIPEGTTLTVDYKPDGQLAIERTSGDETVALPDAAKLKKMLDAVNIPSAVYMDLNLRSEGLEIALKRKPGASFTVP